jgi:hypothetical protein
VYDALNLIRLGITQTQPVENTFYKDTSTGIAASVVGAGRVASIRLAYGEPPGPKREVIRRRMRPLSHHFGTWHRETKAQKSTLENVLTGSQMDAVSSMPSFRSKGEEVSLTETAIYLYQDTGLTRLGVLDILGTIVKSDHIDTILEVTDHRLMTPRELAEAV